jgi:uncharacterized protein YjbI with pentapeptide repeats
MAEKRFIVALKSGGEGWKDLVESTSIPLDFSGDDLSTCNLTQRAFPREAVFDGATFNAINLTGLIQKPVTFKHATIRQAAHIRPEGKSSESIVDFSEAEFLQDVKIEGREGHPMVLLFHKVKFRGRVNVFKAGALGKVDFAGAEFHGDVRVSGENGHLVFAGAKFGVEKAVSATFRGTLSKRVDFSHARFRGPADFENVKFAASCSFADCIFEKAPTFHGADLHQGITFSPPHKFPRLFLDTKSEEAGNAYRTLKLAMNAQHAHSEELGFFLLEMRSTARYQKWWVRPFFHLYDKVSRYGASVWRPAALFVGINVAAGLLFSCLTNRPWGWWAWDAEVIALTLFGSIPFAPALRSQVPEMAEMFPSNVLVIIPVIVAVQGLLNAALLFLVLLGIRNTFRIK